MTQSSAFTNPINICTTNNNCWYDLGSMITNGQQLQSGYELPLTFTFSNGSDPDVTYQLLALNPNPAPFAGNSGLPGIMDFVLQFWLGAMGFLLGLWIIKRWIYD